MDITQDDVVIVLAIRARAKDAGDVLSKTLDVLGLEGDYAAHVVTMGLEDAYQRLGNDRLRDLGFTFDSANQVVPVLVGHE